MSLLADKLVVITGADSGLGMLLTDRFLNANARLVLVTKNEHTNRLEAFLKQVGFPSRCRIVPVDFSDDDSFASLTEDVFKVDGSVDVLINNIGQRQTKGIFDVSASDWDLLIQANLRIPFFLTQKMSQAMQANFVSGSIVNIASHLGIVASQGHSLYSIAKGGLISMTKAFAIELANAGICVNAVAPGPTNTARAGLLSDENDVVSFLQRMPIGRRIEPLEVAYAVEYLAGIGGGAVTGHTLVVDGGWTAV